jgi:hypothetical protein
MMDNIVRCTGGSGVLEDVLGLGGSCVRWVVD